MITEYAWAKLNLSLDVIGLREDGYHDVSMIMQSVDLVDTIHMQEETGRSWELTCDTEGIPCDSSNLCWKAASFFCEETGYDPNGLRIELYKQIPSQAGMGGGSSDAAAVLRVLNRACESPLTNTELMWLAGAVGSDVPFCLYGGTAFAQGKGDELERLSPLPSCYILICTPHISISTPELYHMLDLEDEPDVPDTTGLLQGIRSGDLDQVGVCMKNVFQPLVSRMYPEIQQIQEVMDRNGSIGSSMSGTGPTMFGLYRSKSAALRAKTILENTYPGRVWLTKPI